MKTAQPKTKQSYVKPSLKYHSTVQELTQNGVVGSGIGFP
jgi:hypothetical protein